MHRLHRLPRRSAAVALCLALAAGVSALPTVPAHAYHGRFDNWARQGSARIRPGNAISTSQGGCTTNFVFTDKHRKVYVGTAAHCFTTEDLPVSLDGCSAGTLAPGARATIEGARYSGVLVYSSWYTMQRRHEGNDDACLYNDFALVRVSRSDRRRVNPTVPHWGGPKGVAGGARVGQEVVAYTNSEVWMGNPVLRRKQGYVVDQWGGGWSYDTYTAPPSVSGDSGSGYLLAGTREALGILVTLNALSPGSNGVTSLRHALRYMKAKNTGFLDSIRIANARP